MDEFNRAKKFALSSLLSIDHLRSLCLPFSSEAIWNYNAPFAGRTTHSKDEIADRKISTPLAMICTFTKALNTHSRADTTLNKRVNFQRKETAVPDGKNNYNLYEMIGQKNN